MVDMLTRVFMAFASRDQEREEFTSSSAIYSALLVGERTSSRSLLLLAAVTAASQLGGKVVFFTQTHIQQLPAFLQKCIPILNPESLKKIRFCYPRTFEDLLQQIAALHECNSASSTPPSLIIVDGLEAYLHGPTGSAQAGFHPEHLSGAAHLSALLCDTSLFLTQGSAPCQLIASYQSEDHTGQTSGEARAADSVLDVLERFFQARCTLTKDESYEAEAAGMQEMWRIYISGPKDFNVENCEDSSSVDQEWQIFISSDGSMEFKMV